MVLRESDSRPPSEARTRLLKTAGQLFYAEGIHSVGVDRIVAEARVTRATFYRHFPSKETLVVAYLTEAHRAVHDQVDAAVAAQLSAADTIRSLGSSIAESIRSPGFRGCAFLNAVAEYPDADHPVHRAVLEHRQWFLDTSIGLVSRIHEQSAERAAQHFVMMRDGAMASGCLFDPALVTETFLTGMERLLEVHSTRSSPKPS
ncbi:TetR/AcrR family transcriptional regulator [Streptomyces triticagri]|uniref:TetR/AcrR family transcriptional regulator n=1 Tax=Streptomyces triticagri TaxID=2293568 RepID=A0A372MC21_9ACTN|nr:TetR/AcrR family transcriptional regulator [Streptomyces triticagri]RFU88150.1 TetR/AcrR family transcriptional regulator [Streptomyces triticagri]